MFASNKSLCLCKGRHAAVVESSPRRTLVLPLLVDVLRLSEGPRISGRKSQTPPVYVVHGTRPPGPSAAENSSWVVHA